MMSRQQVQNLEIWDSPGTLGMSQKPGTVPGRCDRPKDPESQHHGVYFSISETQKTGTVLGLGTVAEAWDGPGMLGLSQRPRVPTPWSIFLNLRDPKTWDSNRTLELSQKPRILTPWSIFLNIKDPGTVPEAQDSPNFKVFDTCCRPFKLC